nr:zinc finger, CCHC-type [Tanacetum cinerariifolium]
MGKTVNELHAMLKLHEETLPKKDANHALHVIRAGRVQKNQKNRSHKAGKGSHGKGEGKMGNALNNASFASKPKTPPPPKKYNPAKDAICHQCGEVRHWRRNCPVYLVELMKKKKLSQGASTSAKNILKVQYNRVFCVCCVQVKEYQEKDKIRTKPDKNEKRGEAGRRYVRFSRTLINMSLILQKKLDESNRGTEFGDLRLKKYSEKDKIRSKPDKNRKHINHPRVKVSSLDISMETVG